MQLPQPTSLHDCLYNLLPPLPLNLPTSQTLYPPLAALHPLPIAWPLEPVALTRWPQQKPSLFTETDRGEFESGQVLSEDVLAGCFADGQKCACVHSFNT